MYSEYMKNFLAVLISGVIFFLCSQQIFAQVPAGQINPVIWKTAYNEFSSGNFYIQIGETRFLGAENVKVHSDPGVDKSTLELEWTENGIPMRLYFYFEKIENGMWQLYDLRTYNARGTDWIYYQTVDSDGNPVKSLVGQRDYRDERTFLSKDGSAKIYCKDCSITAFISNIPPPSVYGYIIDFRIGISQNETITVTNDPNTGYGVNAVLLDSSGTVVKDQSDFSYTWKSENELVLTIKSQSVPYPDGNCAYGILAPCPDFNVQIKGINPGISRVLLDVIRRSDRTVVASNAFTVKVVEKNMVPLPTITPTPKKSPIPTPTEDNVTAQLKELQGEVGRLSKTVEQQQTDLNVIQKIVHSIQVFLRRVFGWSL
jgi:hypothetical protein